MGGIGGGGDLLLSESKLEASLAQVGGDWIGLTKLGDPRVFVAGIAIGTASAGATRFGLLSRLSDGAMRVIAHRELELINLGKLRQDSVKLIAQSRAWTAHHARQREGAGGARRPSLP